MRNMLFKKMLAITMSVVVSTGILAGCGQEQKEETKASVSVQEKETSSAVEASSEAEKKEPVVLQLIMHSSPAFNEAVEVINQKFTEKYPWITIETTIEANNWEELRSTRLAAGDVDILEFGCYNIARPEWVIGADPTKNEERIDAGLIMDLTDQEFMNNWSQSALETACTYDGKYYSVTTGRAATNGIYYNKEIFEQYNLKEPKTWQEFIDICEVLKSNGIAPLTSGAKNVWPTNMLWMGIVTASEADPLQFVQDLWSGERKFNDDQSMEFWNKINQLTPYWEENIAAVDYDSVIGRFVAGKAAMMNDATWSAPTIAAADPEFEFGYFAVPGDEAPADGGDVQLKGKYDVGFAGYAHTEHPEEVLLWLEFYSQPEVYEEFINAIGMIPAMDGVEITDPFMNSLASKITGYEKHFEDIFAMPAGVGQYGTIRAARFLKIYGGEIEDVKEIADLAQKDWDEAMAKLNDAK